MHEQARIELRIKEAVVGTLCAIAIGLTVVFAYTATHGADGIPAALDRRLGEVVAFIVGLLTKTGVDRAREAIGTPSDPISVEATGTDGEPVKTEAG